MIHVICSSVSRRGSTCLVMLRDALTSLDTGRLRCFNPRSVFLAAALPAPLPLAAPRKESRHRPNHSSPPSFAETELSPSLNYDPAPSLACFPWWGQISELVHDMTQQCRAGSEWSPLTPLESRCPALFRAVLSLATWNMRCSQECPVLFLLHFVFILAAGREELPDPGRLLSLLAEQGQCGAVVKEAASFCMSELNAWPESSVWLSDFMHRPMHCRGKKLQVLICWILFNSPLQISSSQSQIWPSSTQWKPALMETSSPTPCLTTSRVAESGVTCNLLVWRDRFTIGSTTGVAL